MTTKFTEFMNNILIHHISQNINNPPHYNYQFSGKYTECFFMFCWPCISIYPCNENQLVTLFILSLFHQLTSTCFGHICSPSSGGILYIYNNWYALCFLVDCSIQTRTIDSQLKSTIHTNCCINTVYLLMMGYKYVQNM